MGSDRESWHLKLDRAEYHLDEVACEVRRFSDRRPYEAAPQTYTKGKHQYLRFVLRFTESPDAMLPVIVGDVIHNVRSALDHLVVANVPKTRRRKAAFPIFWRCPFNDRGDVLDSELGRTWTKLTTGLSPVLLAQVKALQPYQPPDEDDLTEMVARGIDPNDVHALGNIGRLDNADKHRALIAVPLGLNHPRATVAVGDDSRSFSVLDGVIKSGAQIAEFDAATFPPRAEVKMELSGTACVALEVRSGKGVLMLPETLENSISHARDIAAAFARLAP